MRVKRRDFFKLSAAGGAALPFNGPVLNALTEEAKKRIIGKRFGEWKPSTCQSCTTWRPVGHR